MSTLPGNDARALAVALKYAPGDAAPKVIAKGRGLIAETIIARAREAGIYVHESPELVALLMQVDLDAHIPENLYTAVAELLAWLHKLEKGSEAGAAAPPHCSVGAFAANEFCGGSHRLPRLPDTPDRHGGSRCSFVPR